MTATAPARFAQPAGPLPQRTKTAEPKPVPATAAEQHRAREAEYEERARQTPEYWAERARAEREFAEQAESDRDGARNDARKAFNAAAADYEKVVPEYLAVVEAMADASERLDVSRERLTAAHRAAGRLDINDIVLPASLAVRASRDHDLFNLLRRPARATTT